LWLGDSRSAAPEIREIRAIRVPEIREIRVIRGPQRSVKSASPEIREIRVIRVPCRRIRDIRIPCGIRVSTCTARTSRLETRFE